MRDTKERFLEKTSPDPNSGCHLWTAYCLYNGYGRFRLYGETVYAHRAAYELFVGPIGVGMCVCHKCDTPSCVNPKHLWLGTHADNVADMIRKGRQPTSAQRSRRGESNGRAKLTRVDVASIRADPRNPSAIAEDFCVSLPHIKKIKKGDAWKHV